MSKPTLQNLSEEIKNVHQYFNDLCEATVFSKRKIQRPCNRIQKKLQFKFDVYRK